MSAPVSPGGGVPCSIVLGALGVAALAVIVGVAQLVHVVVWAVTG